MKLIKNNKKLFTKLLSNVKNRGKVILISLTTIISGLSGAYLIKSNGFLDEINEKKDENDLNFTFNSEKMIHDLYEKYSNKIVYIETERIENLSLLGRFKHALMYINLSNKMKTQQYCDKAVNELVKLSSNNLNDSQVDIIRQLITDNHDLILNLATNPKIDNRLFPNAATPAINNDLIKFKKKFNNNAQIQLDDTNQEALADDADFNFIFYFYESKIKNFISNNNDVNSENLKYYSKKFISTLNALITHDYKLKNRYTILNDPTFLHDDGLVENKYFLVDNKQINLTKKEFLMKLEYLILQILDCFSLISDSDFVKIGGMDLLLILYERHKFNLDFMIPIFDILSKLSLQSEKTKITLFVKSGWIKRIHELVVKLNTDLNTVNLLSSLIFNKINVEKYYKLLEKNLVLKLIVYKIMFNLKSHNKTLYSNMIFPLYPLKSVDNNLNMDTATDRIQAAIHPEKFINNNNSIHDDFEGSIDVIFIHGLLGMFCLKSSFFF